MIFKISNLQQFLRNLWSTWCWKSYDSLKSFTDKSTASLHFSQSLASNRINWKNFRLWPQPRKKTIVFSFQQLLLRVYTQFRQFEFDENADRKFFEIPTLVSFLFIMACISCLVTPKFCYSIWTNSIQPKKKSFLLRLKLGVFFLK